MTNLHPAVCTLQQLLPRDGLSGWSSINSWCIPYLQRERALQGTPNGREFCYAPTLEIRNGRVVRIYLPGDLAQAVTAEIQRSSQEVFRESFEGRNCSKSDGWRQCRIVAGVTQFTRVKLSKTLRNLQRAPETLYGVL
jgi:hypothetical protein